jgi:primosomal protein N' (replication factor Y)
LDYPPFSKIVRLEYRNYDPSKAERAAISLAERIQGWLSKDNRRATRLVGPVPCFFARIGGLYRWQIILIGPQPAALLRDRALNEWRVEVNPPNLL